MPRPPGGMMTVSVNAVCDQEAKNQWARIKVSSDFALRLYFFGEDGLATLKSKMYAMALLPVNWYIY